MAKDNRAMAVGPKEKSTGEGDTEEDEALAHVDKVNLKQRAPITKGKQCDQGDSIQQTDCETNLQIMLVYRLTDFSQCRTTRMTTSCPVTLTPASSMTSTLKISRMQMTGLVIGTS